MYTLYEDENQVLKVFACEFLYRRKNSETNREWIWPTEVVAEFLTDHTHVVLDLLRTMQAEERENWRERGDV